VAHWSYLAEVVAIVSKIRHILTFIDKLDTVVVFPNILRLINFQVSCRIPFVGQAQARHV
jgi:hypothetical protein